MSSSLLPRSRRRRSPSVTTGNFRRVALHMRYTVYVFTFLFHSSSIMINPPVIAIRMTRAVITRAKTTMPVNTSLLVHMVRPHSRLLETREIYARRVPSDEIHNLLFYKGFHSRRIPTGRYPASVWEIYFRKGSHRGAKRH